MKNGNQALVDQPLETMGISQGTRKQQLQTTHTDRLSDTAEVVREVSKKIGNKKENIYIYILQQFRAETLITIV